MKNILHIVTAKTYTNKKFPPINEQTMENLGM